jgi:hypothetical protein
VENGEWIKERKVEGGEEGKGGERRAEDRRGAEKWNVARKRGEVSRSQHKITRPGGRRNKQAIIWSRSDGNCARDAQRSHQQGL